MPAQAATAVRQSAALHPPVPVVARQGRRCGAARRGAARCIGRCSHGRLCRALLSGVAWWSLARALRGLTPRPLGAPHSKARWARAREVRRPGNSSAWAQTLPHAASHLGSALQSFAAGVPAASRLPSPAAALDAKIAPGALWRLVCVPSARCSPRRACSMLRQLCATLLRARHAQTADAARRCSTRSSRTRGASPGPRACRGRGARWDDGGRSLIFARSLHHTGSPRRGRQRRAPAGASGIAMRSCCGHICSARTSSCCVQSPAALPASALPRPAAAPGAC